MKKWIIIILIYLMLIGALVIAIRYGSNMREKYEVAEHNISELLADSSKKNTLYQLTTSQLANAKDSIIQELNNARKALKIKDKNLRSVQYVYSTFEKTDTFVLKDTVFKEPSLKIDTIIGDEWVQTRLTMKYPSSIALSPKFKSEKNIVVSTKKETVNPPKKWWLLRLFQRKHKVLHVDVVESNPYAVDSESRYVEIIK